MIKGCIFDLDGTLADTVESIAHAVNQAIVLEDSETGIDAAFQAGCSVICIPDMIEPDFDHKKKCNYILSNLLDVLTIL